MAYFTLDELRRLVRQCLGEPEEVDFDGDIGDLAFEEMGYDSLALLELATTIQNELGVPIPDEAVEEMTTPRATVDYVNLRIAAA